MARSINYSRVNWKDYPNTDTPKTAANFNVMDKGIDDLDVAVADRALKTEAIKSISRSGTTFTATRCDGTTFTFTQQDNNTTYSNFSRSAAGLVPAAPSGSGTTKYLREDGSWAVPPDNNTDTKVTQTAASDNANYEVLFSATADNTTRTEASKKASNLKFNPSTGNLQATQLNGATIGSSPKFTDTNTWRGIQNNTTSTSTTDSLSANQGYIIANDVPWYATCSTAAATAAKVATTSDTKHALVTGAKVSVKFTNGNTASSPTLNVDSKGAKNIKAYGTTTPTVWWQAGDVVDFVYDGTSWIMLASGGQISQLYSDLSPIDISNDMTSAISRDMIGIKSGNVVTWDGYFAVSGISTYPAVVATLANYRPFRNYIFTLEVTGGAETVSSVEAIVDTSGNVTLFTQPSAAYVLFRDITMIVQ